LGDEANDSLSRKQDILITVQGVAGVGKSTFIDQVRKTADSKSTSDPLKPITEKVQQLGNIPFTAPSSGTSSPLDAILKVSARFGVVKLLRLELEMGASSNIMDSCGNTPLHYAASTGNLEAMRLLIEYGADVHAESDSGDTALSQAAANGQAEAVDLLLGYGANALDTPCERHEENPPHSAGQKSTQRLSLVVTLSSSCPDCGDFQSHYVASNPLSPRDILSLIDLNYY
jgi:hypothetical protein